MSRQYQDGYHSGHYQTPNSNPSQLPGQFAQPLHNTRDTYNDPSSQHAYSSYPENSLQPQPSRQRHSSRSPYVGTVPFPEPQISSAGHPQTYLSPLQTTQNLTVGTYQQERQGSYGLPPTGSSPDAHRFYAEGGSDTGRGSNIYSHPGEGYTGAQPQAWNDGAYDGGHETRPKSPGRTPTSTNRHALCRLPGCYNQVFFDRQVNELQEWCSEQHMQAAIKQRVEKPCSACKVRPRRNGSKVCSRTCGYTATTAQPQDWGAAGHNQGLQGHGSQSRAPVNPPVGGHRPVCRYPGCNNPPYFDRRVNRLSEWCSNEHMQAATTNNREKPCDKCRVWPRRRGSRFCGGNACIYPH